MFGSGKRKRELVLAAKNATTKLFEGAIFEDRRRRGDTDKEPSSSDERARTIAAWYATAGLTWKKAKGGDIDALRQTARNYLFGTGMPVKPRKARFWLAVAHYLEDDLATKNTFVDPFWNEMEEEINKLLTEKELTKELYGALDWVTEHRRLNGR